MNEQEAKLSSERLGKYRELEALRNQLYTALKALTEPWPTGPCTQNPFTGNWRESRGVHEIHIYFTATRGGSPAVETTIANLGIEACDLGKALEAMLRARIALVSAEMEKI